ncbi:inner membrane protein [Dyella jiangningensis]|uniref:metal-dependent hydrolase n=1 Tax=Dyella sp. AtDHG13 TaxID=1938897 RepID=UPI00089275AE|nr:metal-dependent hydrolase [Dyella sp. AtDHG13]PXV61637.1 inner membrane protein [Dyella sp. AtDHG13]SDJ68820.1 inner membrane protein [Dyella jiangningensis]
MTTVFTHAVVPLMLGAAMGRRRISSRLRVAGAVAAMLPDADVLAFHLHIPYADAFGHRGATHSLAFAAMLGLLAAWAYRWLDSTPRRAGWFVGLATLSHPLLDACTDGGLGVALWWPFSDARWFAPFHPIAVSPIGARFFSERGAQVIASELCWVWLPVGVLAVCILLARRASKRA